MPRHPNKISSLDKFLIKSGVLAQGEQEIKQAKKEYWNKQKAEWRKKNRSKTKSVTVAFTNSEYLKITKQANRHSLSRTKYTHDAVLSYGDNKVLALDSMTANYIREALQMNYHLLRDLRDDQKITSSTATQTLNILESVEKSILESLQHPQRIEHAILGLITIEPAYRSKLIEFLNVLP